MITKEMGMGEPDAGEAGQTVRTAKRSAPRHIAFVGANGSALWADTYFRKYSLSWNMGFRWDTHIARGTFSPDDAANIIALLDMTPRGAMPDYVRRQEWADCRAAMQAIITGGKPVSCHSVG